MQTRFILPALFALLLTSPWGSAQSEVKETQAPREAGASKLEPGVPLLLGVLGMTQDNVGPVKQGLAAMRVQVHVCAGCKHEQVAAGRCTPCNCDLTTAKLPLLFEVVPSLEAQTIRVTPMTARTLRYSELEVALMKESIRIDPAKFPLPGKARLVLLGGTSEEAKVLERALVDAKLFEMVKAEFDAASGEIHIRLQSGATPPLHARVLAVLDGAKTKAKLTDVLWEPAVTPTKA